MKKDTKKTTGPRMDERGFSFIEIMVVVVILGILAGMIVPRYMGKTDEAKAVKAKVDIAAIETGLRMYKLDNGVYPNTEQGLLALVEKPSTEPVPLKYSEKGYLEKGKIPKDPWGREYLYLSPGVHDDYDIISYGADGIPGGEGKIRILKAGNLNRAKRSRGFTLVEVVVVIAIISVLLFFTAPLFRGLTGSPDTDTQVNELITLIRDLKQRAVEENKDYALNIDPSAGRIWVSHDAMDDEALSSAKLEESRLFADILIHEIEFPGIQEKTPASIRFYKKGYSDMALIHIRAEDREVTLKIEPFLSSIQQEDGYFSYHDCM